MRLTRPLACVPVALLALTAAAGCGGSSKGSSTTPTDPAQAQIKQVIAQFGSLSRAGEGRAICDQILTRNLELSIRKASSSGSCITEMLQNVGSKDTNFTLLSASIKQDYAVVRVKDQKGRTSQLLMQRVGGTWRIARIG